MKKKLLAVLLVIVMVTALLPLSAIGSIAIADDNGTLYVHFYNGDGEYTYDNWGGKPNVQWGAYYWIDAGKVVGSIGDDEEFSKELEDGSMNVGKVFQIKFNATEGSAVKSGKKLGLIMVRSYVDELGYLTPYWNGNTGKDLNSDRMVEVNFDGNGEAHIWIIAGDKNNYTSLEQAKSAFERIESAKFMDFDTIELQTTKKITASTNITIFKNTDLKNNERGEVYKENIHVSTLRADGLGGTITGLNMESDFDWNANYELFIEDVSVFTTSAIKTRLYLSEKFKKECLPTEDLEFGAIYNGTSTTFRLWAPISTNVDLNLYRYGDEVIDELYAPATEMEMVGDGVWEVTVNEDLDGVYYTYTNYVEGEAKEVTDVYAKAVGVNGTRGMVCDLNATDPEGWEEDLLKAKNIRTNNSDIGVIWEIHVRDFSISPDNGITYKGKYMAFTEQDTYVKGSTSLKTGISYLKELGVNYVHLNPVYDFATVDEQYINRTDYTTKQNWGYDPKNYNVPEGSYATNAEDGEVRINEFKQMVQSLHDAGIGVIMDVVYNHTYTSDSCFDQTVPGYYYRQAMTDKVGTFGYREWSTNALGLFNLADGSGCSNETASEREMFRKYMIDSVRYWADEYHIDGFRFDLMAIHDTDTMNAIRAELNTLPGGEGILVYGEPWALGVNLDPKDGLHASNTDNIHMIPGVRAFNDRIRNAIKGENSGASGYVQGNMGYNAENIHRIYAGINGQFYGRPDTDEIHAISYTTSHDNYTLWDQLIYSTMGTKSPTSYTEYNCYVEKMNQLAATIVMTSKGTGFMLAGEEIARTKFGNHNSYNAQDKINAIDYNRQEEFSTLFNWYKGLIELRTKRFTTIGAADKAFAEVNSTATTYVQYVFTRAVATDQYSKVQIILNPTTNAADIDIMGAGNWIVIAGENGFDFNSAKTVSGTVTVPACTAYILVQK